MAIGRAIVKEPDVFLFDEPLSNLDAALRVQTRLEIAKLHHDIGKASMIYVTHDQVEAMTLADKIVLLRAGKGVQDDGSVAQFGSPMDLYHRPQNLFVAEFIGSPKMNVMPGKLVRAEAEPRGGRGARRADHRGGRRARHGCRRGGVDRHPTRAPAGIGDDGEGCQLHVKLHQMERLGDESLLYLTSRRSAAGDAARRGPRAAAPRRTDHAAPAARAMPPVRRRRQGFRRTVELPT